MTTLDRLNALSRERILILDGAMGTMIQGYKLEEEDFRGERFVAHGKKLRGCNDLLCLTRPDVIKAIHRQYLEAGADLIETCSFNANTLSLADYDLAPLAREISREAARLARAACDEFSTTERPRFVVGVLGPTGKTASLSPDVNDGAARGTHWDELVAAYTDNALGLIEGGADLLMIETIFDTLNAKAAVFAIEEATSQAIAADLLPTGARLPLMISGTITDAAGRTLSGQTVEAFHTSLAHAEPWSFGLNCALGADKLLPHLEALASTTAFLVSAHPNAGLPNSLGEYDQSARAMADAVTPFLEKGLVNVIGGCCGSTPAHIAAIAERAAAYPPRKLTLDASAASRRTTRLSGLEVLEVSREKGFVDVGERTNVAGSRKFLRLIKEEKWEEATLIARDMADSGAAIIDVCMDDALLDAKDAMVHFLNLAQSDPEIARLPFMIDSSRWEVLEAGLKVIQGKGIVNSISLKEGEERFLERVRLARRYGAAIVVMLFDEKGQADSYARKIEVAGRSWQLLMAAGFPGEDVVFDPNVLSIATGIAEHDRYALDFIEACRWIVDHCPGAHISGGLSNLSFSFRGNEEVREAMHAVFLSHAIPAGLSMAIVNPATLLSVAELDQDLAALCEDVIMAKGPQAVEALLAKAVELKEAAIAAKEAAAAGGTSTATGTGSGGRTPTERDAWRSLPLADRIAHALVKGIDDYIEEDVLALRTTLPRALDLIEGPLMAGMNEVGKRFGEGRMFLPQVIRSARVMKKAVAVLEPYILEEKQESDTNAATIVMATVKGDVHDIGKNIVGVVLSCNGFRVVDLGVMVPCEEIIEAVKREKADILGLSGLITPSLDEMVTVAKAMEAEGMSIPLMVGGATTSETHTALRIDPAYSGPVVHGKDASQMPALVRALLSPTDRPRFLDELDTRYAAAIERHEKITATHQPISLEKARANAFKSDWQKLDIPRPRQPGITELAPSRLEELFPWIDWSWFFYGWDMGYGFEKILEDREKGPAARKLYDDARALLDRFAKDGLIKPRARIGIFPATSEGDDILVRPLGLGPKGLAASVGLVAADAEAPAAVIKTIRLPFLRNQQEKKAGGANACLADFIAPSSSGREDWIGFFACTVGRGFEEWLATKAAKDDEYEILLAKSLADRLAEALAEWAHATLRREIWGYAPDEKLAPQETLIFAADGRAPYRGIRPAFGYPACPDHEDKRLAFALLDAEESLGLSLTDSAMMLPAASVCGMYFAHPAAWYFGTGSVDSEQVADWARRKAISLDDAKKRLSSIAQE